MDVAALILLLFSLLAPPEGAVELVDRHHVPVQNGARYHEARGATWCYPDGSYRVRVATRRDGWEETLAHELIHAYDCAHNGRIDGSPGHPRPALRPAGISDEHWAAGDDPHWYVHEVLRTGRLDGRHAVAPPAVGPPTGAGDGAEDEAAAALHELLPSAPRFSPPPAARGVSIATWGGGPLAALEEAAPGARSLWVSEGGRLVGYVPGAPAFVNEPFARRFPDGAIPSGRAVVVVR